MDISKADIIETYLKPLALSKEASSEWQVSNIQSRRDCEIYKCENADLETPLALKIYGAHKREIDTPAALYKALEQYYDADSTAYNVPKPYALYDDQGAVLMEWIKQPKLRGIMWHFTLHRYSAIERCAAWLKWFHGKQETKMRPYQDTALRKIAAATNDPNFIAPQHFEESLQSFVAFINKHKNKSILHGRIHGDFTPYNILLDTQKRMIGIDFTAQEIAPLYTDIARFFMYMNSYRPVYLSAKKDYAALKKGYGFAENDELHRTILLGEVLRRWSTLTLAKAKKPFHLWRETELIRLSFMAKALTKNLR